jgi:hypothetical protein
VDLEGRRGRIGRVKEEEEEVGRTSRVQMCVWW